jgi:hypothetical protein
MHHFPEHHIREENLLQMVLWKIDNFRMNTRYGRYGAAYNMIGLLCFKRRTFVVAKESNRGKATSYEYTG